MKKRGVGFLGIFSAMLFLSDVPAFAEFESITDQKEVQDFLKGGRGRRGKRGHRGKNGSDWIVGEDGAPLVSASIYAEETSTIPAQIPSEGSCNS